MRNGYVALGLVTLLGVAASMAVAQPPADTLSHALRLSTGTLDTRELPNALTQAMRSGSFAQGKRHVVQLSGPITEERRQALVNAGVRVGDYLPDNAFIVELDAASPEQVAELGFIEWAGEYDNQWKVSPAIGQRIAPFKSAERIELEAAGKLKLSVTLFINVDLDQAMADLAATGADVRVGHMVGPQGVIGIVATSADLDSIAAKPYVQFIEESSEITFRNSSDRWIVQSNILNVTPLYDNGLHGENQIIGILDGRLDRNHCSFSDSNPIGPTHRKIEAYNTSAGADSHGTHVGGTCVGDNGVNDNTRGVAYLGRLVFNTTPSFTDTASYSYLQTHHNQGARIHTNSWGDDGTTQYNGLARGFDRFQYDYEESLCCLAVTNTSTLRNPENAKNLLACGASQDTPSQHNHCSGGVGPTADGRRKPEIYAPGCGTTSASAGTSCSTQSSTGTSMATPAIAGTALLVRQYYMEGYYPSGAPVIDDAFLPSAALIKATLLNSAVDMTGVSGYPSNLEGWGRLLADNSLHFDGDTRTLIAEQLWNANGLSTGGSSTHDFTVSGNTEQLRVTLVFTEPPATAGASQPVVNNLDLEVTAPDGTTVYRGNVFSGGASVTGGSADSLNNVEQVHVNNPPAGQWAATVSGTAVNQGTQGYAIVITGEVALGPAPPQTSDVSLDLPINTAAPVQLVGFDIDMDPLDYIVTALPAHGDLSDPGAGAIASVPYTLAAGGSVVTYIPDPDFAGPDSFSYKANDGGVAPDGGDSNTSPVALLVIADPPQITTASLADGEVNVAYGPIQLLVDGGQPDVTWELVTDVPYLETDLGTSGFDVVGVAQGWNGDDRFDDYTLPFAFPFYGNDYTAVRVWSNGFLNFGVHTGSSYGNTDQLLIDNARIAPMWDDLRTTVTGNDVFIDESVPGEVTIRWDAVTYGAGAYPCAFSVTLHEEGPIDFHYGPGNNPVSATVGLSAGDGSRYTMSAYNPATSLTGANSIRFEQPAQLSPGLSVSPTGLLSGTPLEAGDYLPVFRVTDGLARTDETAITLTIASVPGDNDGDGDVDLADFAAMADCLNGPNTAPPAPNEVACLASFDFDTDGDVDLDDFCVFQTIFNP